MAGAGTLYAGNGEAVITSDSVNDLNEFDALYVGVGGDLDIVFREGVFGSPVLISNIQDGSILPFRTKHILASTTTATNIVGLTLIAKTVQT